MDDERNPLEAAELTARDELSRIESSTDWGRLAEQAIAEPPNPRPLYWALKAWAAAFRCAEHGEPLEPDYPEPVRAFFQRIILAHYPPVVWDWLIRFKQRKGRPAALSEVPARLRKMIPTSKRGRPRLDTKAIIAARRAWEVTVLRDSYETRRDIIAFFRRVGGRTTCFGLDQNAMRRDRPSILALDLISGELDKSPSRLDQMGVRRRKR